MGKPKTKKISKEARGRVMSTFVVKKDFRPKRLFISDGQEFDAQEACAKWVEEATEQNEREQQAVNNCRKRKAEPEQYTSQQTHVIPGEGPAPEFCADRIIFAKRIR